MWPWEHLAIGYAIYSGFRRLSAGESPGARETVFLAVGTQFPDLVDKPLAWSFGVVPSGLSVAHSLFFALPICALVFAVARRRGRKPLGAAFVIGYLSHLPADMVYGLLTGGSLGYEFLFWPVLYRTAEVGETTFLLQVGYFVGQFQQFLGTPLGKLYVAFEMTLLGAVLVLWARDGYPPLGPFTGRSSNSTDA